eukprot:CAMPEP_0116005988 /NCGR_PEP_ID=MMETSP0321-20121206/1472_1 /TAXON_ID=163516 /ORGANISM="Leptocylindrus danicus var. danicus, Strain B650" /LENGTH=356 /DNA_ID=CAMNT_0003474479 /DNA_START=192 /DNA_END=1262 /DNA_ORIENTATION=-
MSRRMWYERLQTALSPYFDYKFEERLSDMRDEFRQELHMMSEEFGKFPPISAPNLSPSDVIFLIDLWLDSECIFSTSFDGNEGNGSLSNKSCLVVPISADNASARSIELKLSARGHFERRGYNISGKIHAVRLTDGKIICVKKLAKTSGASSYFGIDVGKDVNFFSDIAGRKQYIDNMLSGKQTEIEYHGYISSVDNNGIGNIPTMASARVGSDDDRTLEFAFDIDALNIVIPQSPYVFGHAYTVSKYKDYLHRNSHSGNNISHSHGQFSKFRKNLWRDGATNPELSIFFKQAEEAGSTNGKYYGIISELHFHIYAVLWNPELSTRRSVYLDDASDDSELAGVTVMHLLEDLFEYE